MKIWYYYPKKVRKVKYDEANDGEILDIIEAGWIHMYEYKFVKLRVNVFLHEDQSKTTMT
jgi:hypothetical protein